MIRCTIDTNVPIVANGQSEIAKPGGKPTIACRMAAVEFLHKIINDGTVLLDIDGAIQDEYRARLHPSGQPGVGDMFYREVLNSRPGIVERVELPRRPDGEYADLPQAVIDDGFDPSDRKFAAIAKRERVPVINCVDSDWINHSKVLAANGIAVKFLCGGDKTNWFMK